MATKSSACFRTALWASTRRRRALSIPAWPGLRKTASSRTRKSTARRSTASPTRAARRSAPGSATWPTSRMSSRSRCARLRRGSPRTCGTRSARSARSLPRPLASSAPTTARRVAIRKSRAARPATAPGGSRATRPAGSGKRRGAAASRCARASAAAAVRAIGRPGRTGRTGRPGVPGRTGRAGEEEPADAGDAGDASNAGESAQAGPGGRGKSRRGGQNPFSDLERMAIQFATELRAAAKQTGELGERSLSDLRDILTDTLAKVRVEVFTDTGSGDEGGSGPDAGARPARTTATTTARRSRPPSRRPPSPDDSQTTARRSPPPSRRSAQPRAPARCRRASQPGRRRGESRLPGELALSLGPAACVTTCGSGPAERASVALMVLATSDLADRSCTGEKWCTRMPCAVMRLSRSMVRSQSPGDRCHALESTSTATPQSGHHASGLARNASPTKRLAL